MTQGIESKVVLITGGSTGLGAETARHLASRGARIAITARRKDRLDDVVAQIVDAGGEARAYQLDVTDKHQVKAVVDATVADFGRLDVLINNAGLMPIRPMVEVNTDEWDAMIDVNIKGVLYGIAAALPLFVAQQSGHIINLSSVAGIKVFAPGGTVYSGTKFAVRAISDGLRQENDKIRVTVVCPGVVESEVADSISDEKGREEMKAFRQVALHPDAIARAVRFAVEQPDDVNTTEIVVRPTASPY